MRLVHLPILAIVVLASCQPGLTRQERGVQDQVLRARVTAWARHMNNQAQDSLVDYYDQVPELLSAWPNGERHVGWEEERTALRDLFRGMATLNLVVQDPTVRITDWGSAVVTFRYSMDQYLASDARELFSGHGTQVWIRDRSDQRWRITVSHMSRTPARPASVTARP